MSSWYPTRFDPFSGNFVERFAKLLAADYQISVIHTRGDENLTNIETEVDESEGVRTVRVYHPVHRNRFWHWLTQRKALNRALEMVEDVDLVFAHVILPRGWQFIKAKAYYHCNLVVMEHASYYSKKVLATMSRLHRSILKRTSIHINELLACSEFLQEDMKRIFPTTKTTVLPNFVDTSLFYPSETVAPANAFLHVSTLDPRFKNAGLLIEALKHCKNSGRSDIRLTIVSDQPSGSLKKLAREMEVSEMVTFKGPATWEEVAAEMRSHAAFVLASSYETFSIVLVESWLSGIPTITTAVGIGKDLDPDLGMQIPIDDAKAIAEAMMTIDPSAYNKEALRSRGMNFSEQNITAKAREILERHFDQHG
jgi:L-malate glycosyltransferase